jgi:hypothetical protein
MFITNIQREHLIHACFIAIQQEKSFIDIFSHIHDGSEKEPVSNSKKWIKRYKKLINYLKTKNINK